MRFVRRIEVVVPTLAPAEGPPPARQAGAGARKAKEHETLKGKDAAAKLSFSESWNNEDVRGVLYASHGRVCSYCGCLLPRNDRGDVEHFRPKAEVAEAPEHGGYWWLAYSSENYLLSCGPCNRSRKRSKFPLEENAARATYASKTNVAKEPRLLLDPAIDPVEEWLEVERPVCKIKPRPGLPQEIHDRVGFTLEFFRINLDPDLLKERRAVLKAVLKALEDRDASHARKLATRYRPHSLVALQALDEREPTYLPDPEQELRVLLDDLVGDLALVVELLEQEPQDKILREKARELLWSLAVLWQSPPAGTPAAIENYLRDRDILDTVKKKLKELQEISTNAP